MGVEQARWFAWWVLSQVADNCEMTIPELCESLEMEERAEELEHQDMVAAREVSRERR
jgi:hypothetical protein